MEIENLNLWLYAHSLNRPIAYQFCSVTLCAYHPHPALMVRKHPPLDGPYEINAPGHHEGTACAPHIQAMQRGQYFGVDIRRMMRIDN